MGKILAFGIAKEITGSASFDLEFKEGMNVDELKGMLVTQYPRLQQLSSFAIAVNGEYAVVGQKLSRNDEVAIIPPVSGG